MIEIPPGGSLPPFRVAVEEAIYVLQGRGITHVRAGAEAPQTFEWQSHSLFRIPGNFTYQLSNAQGGQPARLFINSYLPLAMSLVRNHEAFFQSPVVGSPATMGTGGEDFYARAVMHHNPGGGQTANYWAGNFFPDMRAWDELDPLTGRGAGGKAVHIQFPGSEISAHMSVFPPRTYKKAHRHGPGVVIVIPRGEGYSIMWPEGHDKVVVPWHEASCFVPPMRWYHQHFNVSEAADRYLAIHRPNCLVQMGRSGQTEEEFVRQDQIEYPDEDPMVRDLFEKELSKRGLTSLMPEAAYKDPNYRFELMKET